jgi:hypothetical protein
MLTRHKIAPVGTLATNSTCDRKKIIVKELKKNLP